MRDIIFNRAIIFYIIVVLAAVFMWVNYVNTPYLLLAVSIGAIFLLLEMEIFLFYIFCVVFWVPISISYGPLNAVVDGASISEVCIYIGIVGLVLKNVIAGKWKDVLSRIFKMPFLLPIVLFFTGGCIAHMFGGAPDKTFAYNLLRINCFYGPAVYLLFFWVIKKPESAKICMLALIIGGCILGLRYFYFFQFRRDVIVYVESSLELMGGYLPFGKDQLSITNSALAVYLSALTCIAAAFCFVGSKRLERLIGLVGFFVLSFCLVFTQSRSTWIATILGVILVIVLCIKYARLNIFKIALFWVFVIAGIVAFLGYGFLTEATTDRMQSILYSSSDVSLLTRFDIWRDSIGMIIYNPLGMGFRSSYNITLGITSHNIFLATGLACGIIGVISFIWLIVGWFKVMIGRMISSAASDKMIYIAAIGGMFAFLFSSFFDSFNYFFIDVSIMWLVFGITVFDAGGKEAAPSS